jgi:hypothetical protein
VGNGMTLNRESQKLFDTMKELKNFIIGSFILILPLYLNLAEAELPKTPEITISTPTECCFKHAVDKITLHRLLIEKMWKEEIVQRNFKRYFYVILH